MWHRGGEDALVRFEDTPDREGLTHGSTARRDTNLPSDRIKRPEEFLGEGDRHHDQGT